MAIPININVDINNEDESKFIGIKLPLDKSNGRDGNFESTVLTFQAVKFNITNLLKTKRGERVFQPSIGMGMDRYLFENITDDLIMVMKDEIIGTFKRWMPFVNIKTINVTNMDTDEFNGNAIKINIEFFITNNPTMFDSVEVIIQ